MATSYQKLKNKITEQEKTILLLQQQLTEVCINPDSQKSVLIKNAIRWMADLEKGVMFGEPSKESTNGLIKQINSTG